MWSERIKGQDGFPRDHQLLFLPSEQSLQGDSHSPFLTGFHQAKGFRISMPNTAAWARLEKTSNTSQRSILWVLIQDPLHDKSFAKSRSRKMQGGLLVVLE
jgi:hypothetical protein